MVEPPETIFDYPEDGPFQDGIETMAFSFRGTDNVTAPEELNFECRLLEQVHTSGGLPRFERPQALQIVITGICQRGTGSQTQGHQQHGPHCCNSCSLNRSLKSMLDR